MEMKVYRTKICPNCKIVKGFLAEAGAGYKEVDITNAEALTELRMNGIFTLIAPVVQIGSEFLTYDDLFHGDTLQKEKINKLIKGDRDA